MKQSNLVNDLMDILRGPVVLADPSFHIPDRYKNIIVLARLKAALRREELATYPEVSLYLSAASLLAPFDSDWTDIFTFVACSVEQEYFGQDVWDEVKAPRQLSDYQMNYLLKPLQKRIYEKRRKELKIPKKTFSLPEPSLIDQITAAARRSISRQEKMELWNKKQASCTS